MKKETAQFLSKVLSRSADETASTFKIIFGAQKLPKEMKKNK